MVTDLYARLTRSALAGKITRYAIGSIIALLTSVVAFALLYVTVGNTTVCSVGAFLAGAVPNWILNRRWAWKLKGQVSWLREVVAYIVISLLVLIVSSGRHGLDQRPDPEHPRRPRHPRDPRDRVLRLRPGCVLRPEVPGL